jgi:hypothetical protein
MFDKKIYVSLECSYPCIPERILESSANSLVARLKKAFPHIDMDERLTDKVSDSIYFVDETVREYIGGACLSEKELRLFVDVILEREVMRELSRGLTAIKGEFDLDVSVGSGMLRDSDDEFI